MLHKVLSDWSLWVLVFFNLYLLYYYEENPGEFRTLVYLYWVQSALIGLFNFFYLATLPKVKPGSFEVNSTPINAAGSGNGCVAIFFLLHYGVFHFVYLIFLVVKADGNFNYNVFSIGFAIICINLVSDFIR